MTKIYGLPILIGFLLSWVYPDLSIELRGRAIPVLLALSIITSTRYDFRSIKKYKTHTFSLIFSFLFSYPLLSFITFFVCRALDVEGTQTMSLLLVISAPFALVAPLFTRKFSGDTDLSQSLVVISTLLCPFIVYISLFVFDSRGILSLEIGPILRLLSLLAGLMLISLLVSSKISFFSTTQWFKIQSHLSSLFIGLLVYIFWGQTWPLLNQHFISMNELLFFSAFLIFLDIGLFYFLLLIRNTVAKDQLVALRSTLSMRNMAIPATLILTYSPNTLFIPAIGFICHILFFNYLALIKKI